MKSRTTFSLGVRWLRERRDAVALLAGFLLPFVIAAALAPFRGVFANSAAALVLVLAVVAVAADGNRVAGFVAALSGSAWFDFFLTRPYGRFAITDRANIETTLSLLVIGIAVSELAARNRRHRDTAAEVSGYVETIHLLSELVVSGTAAAEVAQFVEQLLIPLLHIKRCLFVSGPSDSKLSRIEPDGSVSIGVLSWEVEQFGLPGKTLVLPVVTEGREVGHFVLQPTPGVPVSSARRVVAVALADQVGAAFGLHLRPA